MRRSWFDNSYWYGGYTWDDRQQTCTTAESAVEYTDCNLCRGVRPLYQRVSWYDTKQSDGEASVMLELWGMWGIPSLQSFPGPL